MSGTFVLVPLVISDMERNSVSEGRAVGLMDGRRLVSCHPVSSLGRVEVIAIKDVLGRDRTTGALQYQLR